MPELPEVEIVKRSLLKMINKAKIIDIKIKNRNLRYKIPKNFKKKLVNQKLLNITRRSKYLIFHFNEFFFLMHLGMTGKLLANRVKDNKNFKTSFYYDLNILKKHNHIFFYLNNGITLIYNDVRRFGFIKIYKNHQVKNISFLKKLGIEPLSKLFNIKYFKEFVKNKDKNIKNLLMDQTFLSGLGNIYVNECLFLSRISPLRSCSNLKHLEIKKLVYYIKYILKLSISKGGSSIKDFVNSSGKSGNFQQLFKVYGQENKVCSRNSCNGKVVKIFISKRSSFYCNKCQN